jgi:hypothetical protein
MVGAMVVVVVVTVTVTVEAEAVEVEEEEGVATATVTEEEGALWTSAALQKSPESRDSRWGSRRQRL